ncbi:MAG: putative toxin-antitoxin system toxin component, PIN family [Coriobacteriia bacterium]
MTRVRMLIDTNVLVSAVLFGGVPGSILEAARGGEFETAVSLHILAEFREVLMRPRFGVPETLVDALAEEIAEFCEVVAVERAESIWSADPDDDPVVEAALRARAEAVVTGDGHLLALKLPNVRFLAPSALMRELEGPGL